MRFYAEIVVVINMYAFTLLLGIRMYCPGFGGVTIFRNDQYEAMDGYSHSMSGF